MKRKDRLLPSRDAQIELTPLEEGLKSAIFADNRAKGAFENLVRHNYEVNQLIIHLTLWARSPKVLFSNSARAELPSRDTKRKLERLSRKLRLIAQERDFCKGLLNPRFLRANRVIVENGGTEMARRVELLPQTLNVYSSLLTRSLLVTHAFARKEKTLNEYRAEFTRIFLDSVKGTTKRDRIDSVVELFNLASRYFGLEEHFEKRALAAQLRRLREKVEKRPRVRPAGSKAP
jgi:hypothetical protein